MKNSEVLNRLSLLIGYIPPQKEIVEKTGIKQANLSVKRIRNSKWKDEEIDKLNQAYNINIYGNESFSNNLSYIGLTYRPNVYLSAGYGVEIYNEEEEILYIDAKLLITERGNHINPNMCEIVRISGNSMSPEYKHGDRVIIDKGDTALLDGHIYAFRYKGSCYVKEMNLLGDKIKCISLNKEYDAFYIENNEDFRVLGRIIPRIRL